MKTCFQTSTISSAMFITAMAANPLAVNLATEALGQNISWGMWALAGAAQLPPSLAAPLCVPCRTRPAGLPSLCCARRVTPAASAGCPPSDQRLDGAGSERGGCAAQEHVAVRGRCLPLGVVPGMTGAGGCAGLVPGLICLVSVPLILYVIYPPEVKDTPDAPTKARCQEGLAAWLPLL